jgi:Fe-S cluster assembly ATP-binding protein
MTDITTMPTASPAADASKSAAEPEQGGLEDRELVIRDLHVVPIAEPTREILNGIDLVVRKGEVHAIMGRNGSGKTTLATR